MMMDEDNQNQGVVQYDVALDDYLSGHLNWKEQNSHQTMKESKTDNKNSFDQEADIDMLCQTLGFK